jgi:hypothetical protein
MNEPTRRFVETVENDGNAAQWVRTIAQNTPNPIPSMHLHAKAVGERIKTAFPLPTGSPINHSLWHTFMSQVDPYELGHYYLSELMEDKA